MCVLCRMSKQGLHLLRKIDESAHKDGDVTIRYILTDGIVIVRFGLDVSTVET